MPTAGRERRMVKEGPQDDLAEGAGTDEGIAMRSHGGGSSQAWRTSSRSAMLALLPMLPV